MASDKRIKAITLVALISAEVIGSSASADEPTHLSPGTASTGAHNTTPDTASATTSSRVQLRPVFLAEQQDHAFELPDTPALGRTAPLLSGEAQEMLNQLKLSILLDRIESLKARVQAAGPAKTVEDLAGSSR